jgi:hypothetical protein
MRIIKQESTKGYNYNQAIITLYYQLGVRLPQHGQEINRLVNLVLFFHPMVTHVNTMVLVNNKYVSLILHG